MIIVLAQLVHYSTPSEWLYLQGLGRKHCLSWDAKRVMQGAFIVKAFWLSWALSTNCHVHDIFVLMCKFLKFVIWYYMMLYDIIVYYTIFFEYIMFQDYTYYNAPDMLWQLDVSLTNASVQDESGRIRGTEFKARATSMYSMFVFSNTFQVGGWVGDSCRHRIWRFASF